MTVQITPTTAPTYPGTGIDLTVDAFASPGGQQIILRKLTSLVAKKLVADKVLMRGSAPVGGSATFQKSESLFPDREPGRLGVRTPFPRTGWSEELFQAFVEAFGLETPISFLAIRRRQTDLIGRATMKLSNGLTRFVDTMLFEMLLDEPDIEHVPASNPWDGGSADILGDLTDAKELIEDVTEEEYEADTLIVPSIGVAKLFITDSDIRDALPRETTTSMVQTGNAAPLLGIKQILKSSALKALAPTSVILLQSNMVGTIADETPVAREGYTAYTPEDGDNGNVYLKMYDEVGPGKPDEMVVRCARWPLMYVSEPKAAVVIEDVISPT